MSAAQTSLRLRAATLGRRLTACLLVLAPLGAATAAEGDANKEAAFRAVADRAQMDLTVPASPAFTILGMNPDKVQRPGTVQQFAASVVRGLDADGHTQEGLAIDFSPVSLFARSLITGGSDYAPKVAGSKDQPTDLAWHGYLRRLAARTTVSLASTQPDETGAARSAWGLRVGVIDFGDPGLYWQFTAKCLREAPTKPLPGGRDLTPTPDDGSLDICNPLTNPDGMRTPLWAQPALYVGYGQSWYSKTGTLHDRDPDAKAMWMSFTIGHMAFFDAGKDAQLGGLRVLGQVYASRRLDERATDPNDSTQLVRKDADEASLRLRLGRENWHAFVEAWRRRSHLGSTLTEHVRSKVFGAEVQVPALGRDTWLQAASVRESGFADGKDKAVMTVGVKFGAPFLDLPGSQ